MQTQPYKRSKAFMDHIFMIRQLIPGVVQQELEISKLSYKSRGKGGKTAHTTGHKHMAYVRKQRKVAAKRK